MKKGKSAFFKDSTITLHRNNEIVNENRVNRKQYSLSEEVPTDIIRKYILPCHDAKSLASHAAVSSIFSKHADEKYWERRTLDEVSTKPRLDREKETFKSYYLRAYGIFLNAIKTKPDTFPSLVREIVIAGYEKIFLQILHRIDLNTKFDGTLPNYPADDIFFSFLHLAAAYGHVEIIKTIFTKDKGLNVNLAFCRQIQCSRMETIQGPTPLMLAAANGKIECINELIEMKANLDLQSDLVCTAIRFDMRYIDKKEKVSALSLAAENGHLACVKVLVDKGASLQLIDMWKLAKQLGYQTDSTENKTQGNPIRLTSTTASKFPQQNDCFHYLSKVMWERGIAPSPQPAGQIQPNMGQGPFCLIS